MNVSFERNTLKTSFFAHKIIVGKYFSTFMSRINNAKTCQSENKVAVNLRVTRNFTNFASNWRFFQF